MASPVPQVGLAYLACEGFEHLLAQELEGLAYTRYERLFVLEQKPSQPIYWWDNCWEELYLIECPSITAGAKALKSLQRSWWPYSWQLFRRAALLQEALPFISSRPLTFGKASPASPLGSWTLLNEQLILASPRCQSPRPNGMWEFVEDKVGPPSRAYLKLWEVFSRFGKAPAPGERCLDLGASPGGWSWVLRQCQARVHAYDRSPLRED